MLQFLQFYFWHETLHVLDSSSVHHQEFFTVHRATVCVIPLCRELASKLSANWYDIYHCSVYSEKLLMMDRGTVRNVHSFMPKMKLEKLEHLVGFILTKKKESIIVPSTRRGIKQIVITIGEYHFCQLRTKFCPTSCSQG